MTIQEWLWAGAGAAALVMVAAALADRLRARRRDIDNPGWVPWHAIQVLAMFVGLGFAVLAVVG